MCGRIPVTLDPLLKTIQNRFIFFCGFSRFLSTYYVYFKAICSGTYLPIALDLGPTLGIGGNIIEK